MIKEGRKVEDVSVGEVRVYFLFKGCFTKFFRIYNVKVFWLESLFLGIYYEYVNSEWFMNKKVERSIV